MTSVISFKCFGDHVRFVVDAEVRKEWERNEFVLHYAGRHQHWREVTVGFTEPNLLPHISCEPCASGCETEIELPVGNFSYLIQPRNLG